MEAVSSFQNLQSKKFSLRLFLQDNLSVVLRTLYAFVVVLFCCFTYLVLGVPFFLKETTLHLRGSSCRTTLHSQRQIVFSVITVSFLCVIVSLRPCFLVMHILIILLHIKFWLTKLFRIKVMLQRISLWLTFSYFSIWVPLW